MNRLPVTACLGQPAARRVLAPLVAASRVPALPYSKPLSKALPLQTRLTALPGFGHSPTPKYHYHHYPPLQHHPPQPPASIKPTIHSLFEPATSTWQYIVADPSSSQAVIIDPVLDYDNCSRTVSARSADALISLIQSKGYIISHILETHAHADHLTAAFYLQRKFAASQGAKPPVGIGKRIGQVQSLFGKRCDFPGGSAHDLYQSAKKLLSLPDHVKIWVGHDYPVKGERGPEPWTSRNKHIRDGIAEEEFVEMRKERDSKLAAPRLVHESLQVNIRAGQLPKTDEVGMRAFKLPVKVQVEGL
ncbi:hypothetical protein N0V88_005177 [Collariella sp. IMI 366227]|nr:hypothetical protein N0V88_005177 [Collariella sp. IMI 366227]